MYTFKNTVVLNGKEKKKHCSNVQVESVIIIKYTRPYKNLFHTIYDNINKLINANVKRCNIIFN